MVIGIVSSASFFLLRIIINLFLEKYTPSLTVISNTFATFPYMAIINSLYINLYKIKKDEKHYFTVVISMLLISFILNMICILLFKSIFSVSLATLISFIIWFIYSAIDLKKVKINSKNIITLFIATITFLITSHFSNVYFGMVVYLAIVIIIIRLFYYDTVKILLKKLLNMKGKPEKR